MSLLEYYTLLDYHDWNAKDNYQMEVARDELKLLSKQSPQHGKLYDDFYNWAINGGKHPVKISLVF